MRVSFYIKLFFAFIVFAILLLGFSSFAFNNFYEFHNQKKDKENIVNILNYQENSFKSYVRFFDEKLFLLNQKNFLQIEDKEKSLELFKKILFNNENILEFKVISLDAQEIIKVTKDLGNIKIVPEEKLQNIYSNSHYKNIRTLKEEEIWHDNSNLEKPTIINFILREKNYFLILKFDFSSFFTDIYKNFDKKTLVISDNNIVVNSDDKNFDSFKKDDISLTNQFISKKIYLNENKYFIFITNIEEEVNNNYLQEYYKSIIIIGLGLSIILSLLFSKPIAKLNKIIEDENKDLDLSIKKNFIELNENQKVIDKHIMFIRMSKNNIILEASSAFCYFLGFSKGELIGHDYKMLIHKDTKKKEYIKLWKFVKKGKSYVGEIKGIKKDGESFWVDLFVEPNFDNLKQIVGYTIITYDTTYKKKIEELYKNMNNQVEQYNAIFEMDSINKNEYIYLCKVQKQRMEQVWIIVINNALDELIKIDNYEDRILNINIFEDNNEIIIKFKDTAGGINKEIISDIFEPFISSKLHSGMGVGLNIAKKIVDEQDGKIRAYNEDSGAVFEIKLQKCEEE